LTKAKILEIMRN